MMRKSNSVSIFSALFWAIVLLPIFGENTVEAVLRNYPLYRYLLFVASSFIIVVTAMLNKGKFDSFTVVVIFLILLRCIITFYAINSGVSISVQNNQISPLGFIAYLAVFWLINSLSSNHRKLSSLFYGLEILTTFLVVLNLFFSSKFQLINLNAVMQDAISTGYTGDYPWMFGHRNKIFPQHLIWMLFSSISCYLRNKNYIPLFVFQSAFNLLVGIVSWSATMLACSAIIFLMVISELYMKFNIIHYLITYFLSELGFVFLRIQDMFAFIIKDILHRNLTFTGRTYLWDYYIEQYVDGNILGWLFGNMGVSDAITNPHNLFLDILVFTGIVGLVLYYSMLYFCARNIYRLGSSTGRQLNRKAAQQEGSSTGRQLYFCSAFYCFDSFCDYGIYYTAYDYYVYRLQVNSI